MVGADAFDSTGEPSVELSTRVSCVSRVARSYRDSPHGHTVDAACYLVGPSAPFDARHAGHVFPAEAEIPWPGTV